MKKSNILKIAFFSIMTSAMMTSCSKENTEEENLDPDEVEVIEEEVLEECDGMLSITSDAFDFSGLGKAQLFKAGGDCQLGQSAYALNYHVVDAEWDSWGIEPSLTHVPDGIPGFAFGIAADAEAGDEAILMRDLVGGESLIVIGDGRYELAGDYTFTLSEVGDEDGEFIGGTISGVFADQNTGEEQAFETSFCVPVTLVCE